MAGIFPPPTNNSFFSISISLEMKFLIIYLFVSNELLT